MKCEIVATLAATLLVTSAFAQTPKLATDETMVKSPDAGIEIYVRNKRPTDMTLFRPEHARQCLLIGEHRTKLRTQRLGCSRPISEVERPILL